MLLILRTPREIVVGSLALMALLWTQTVIRQGDVG
jgi:hypothetical protein